MYIVEFIAPAGSGKSTLCNALIKKKRFIGQNASSALKYLPFGLIRFFLQISRFKFLSYFIFKLFNLFHKFDVAYLKYILPYTEDTKCIEIYFKNVCNSFVKKQNTKKARDRLSFFISSATSFNLIKASKKNGIGILDEGFAQRGISLIYHGASETIAKEYYENTPLPDLLVILKIDSHSLIKRLKIRSKNKPWFFDYIDTSIRSLDDCKKIYQNRGCNILELDNNETLEKNIDLILERLKHDK